MEPRSDLIRSKLWAWRSIRLGPRSPGISVAHKSRTRGCGLQKRCCPLRARAAPTLLQSKPVPFKQWLLSAKSLEPTSCPHGFRAEHARPAMPRYFFHIKDTGKTMLDQEGIELDDLYEVREKATRGARQIMREQARLGRPRDDQSFVVTDEQGQTVLTLPFKRAIRD